MTPEMFELEVRRLCGARLSRVRYYEVSGGDPAWDAIPELDTADFGLDLVCDTGAFHITWDSTFWSYGLRVKCGTLLDHLRSALFTEVTEASRWTTLIGQQITDVTVQWDDIPLPEYGYGTHYPQEIILSFELGAHVLLSAATYQDESHTLFGMSDNVVVIFDEAVARRFGVGPTEAP